MNIKWTNKITNEELKRITHQKPIENQIKKMELEWTHITQRSTSNTEKSIGLESSGIQEKRQAEENAAKNNRGLNKRKEQEDHGIRSREQLEIVMPGRSSWMPYAPQGEKGLDDDDSLDQPTDNIYMYNDILPHKHSYIFSSICFMLGE